MTYRTIQTIQRVGGATLIAIAIVVFPALWVVNCSGPILHVHDVRVQRPTSPGGGYHIVAHVTNYGPGHGQVLVTFTLRDKQTGALVTNNTRLVLGHNQTAIVSDTLTPPPGHYAVSVNAVYPP